VSATPYLLKQRSCGGLSICTRNPNAVHISHWFLIKPSAHHARYSTGILNYDYWHSYFQFRSFIIRQHCASATTLSVEGEHRAVHSRTREGKKEVTFVYRRT
jgi:hypothetical protein